ncbi:MAG: signal recognition particle-docking protein FtsY [Candidatus Thermoplasmatota archaeon]|nr:signal recognition particle-docking protein FtsY [Candidatus Thermoplasmatota archaeon]
MGFLGRFRRSAKTLDDIESISSDEDLPNDSENSSETRKMETASISEQEVETEWESTEMIDSIHLDRDKKSQKLVERKRKFQKSTKRDSIKKRPSKLVPRPSQGLSIDIDYLVEKKSRRKISDTPTFRELMSELETTLLEADMGHAAVDEVLTAMRGKLIGAPLHKKGDLEMIIDSALVGALDSLLRVSYWDFDQTVQILMKDESPVVIMLVGVNGTGKTTTAAKISYRLIQDGLSVVLAAADTFRAGAIDQLNDHAERIGARCIRSQRGGDSAAVARDAIDSAVAREDDIVIIDTAGRMQNKTNLMQELKKVHRVASPHIVLFVGDALAGNDAVEQARTFQSFLNFDGAVLSKLDTDARGGAALSIAHATNKPIVLAGVGQGYDDLIDFEPSNFLTQLLSDDIDPLSFKIVERDPNE